MKNWIWATGMFLCFLTGCSGKSSYRETMPPFSLETPSGQKFTLKNLKNKPTVFFYFESTCDHCLHQAGEIAANLPQPAPWEFVLVSEESPQVIQQFLMNTGLQGKTGIFAGSEPTGKMKKSFGVSSTPTLVLYDKSRRLVKLKPGQMKIKEIEKAFAEQP